MESRKKGSAFQSRKLALDIMNSGITQIAIHRITCLFLPAELFLSAMKPQNAMNKTVSTVLSETDWTNPDLCDRPVTSPLPKTRRLSPKSKPSADEGKYFELARAGNRYKAERPVHSDSPAITDAMEGALRPLSDNVRARSNGMNENIRTHIR